jgi:hypothetical protein
MRLFVGNLAFTITIQELRACKEHRSTAGVLTAPAGRYITSEEPGEAPH